MPVPVAIAGREGEYPMQAVKGEYLMQAVKDDARRAGERDRLLLEAHRARRARRHDAGPAAPVWRWARLLARRATA